MKSAVEMVRQFHEHVGAPVDAGIESRIYLRFSLIEEEFKELIHAFEQEPVDTVGVADALADLCYVVIGTAIEWDVPLAEVFAEVHRSNMTKSRDNVRADGKITKGESFKPPRIAEILEGTLCGFCGADKTDDGDTSTCDDCEWADLPLTEEEQRACENAGSATAPWLNGSVSGHTVCRCGALVAPGYWHSCQFPVDVKHSPGRVVAIKDGTITIDDPPVSAFESVTMPTSEVKRQLGELHDPVNRPSHYVAGKFECLEVIEALGLGFHLANALKYLWRAGKKDDELQDLAKAAFYINRRIAQLEAQRG